MRSLALTSILADNPASQILSTLPSGSSFRSKITQISLHPPPSLLSSRASAPPTKLPLSSPPPRAAPVPLLLVRIRSSLKVAPRWSHSPKLVPHSPPSVRAAAQTLASMASKSPGSTARSHRSLPGYAEMESLAQRVAPRPHHYLFPAPRAASKPTFRKISRPSRHRAIHSRRSLQPS